jgi:hypothetical protein
MAKKSETRHFTESFLMFLVVEFILYAIVVYFDLLGLKVDSPDPRLNPAMMAFFGLSSMMFIFFAIKVERKH